MSADPVVVAGVAARLHALAVDLWAAGHKGLARTLERESRRLAPPVEVGGCKGCGGPVPEVRVGRPRLYCEECRRPRTKVDAKVSPPDMVAS